VGREEQLQWERKWGPGAAAAAFGAALLPIAATIYASSLLGKLPSNADDVFLERVHAHASGYIGAGVITAIGTILLGPVLVYLYYAIKARRPQIPRIALILAVAAPLLAGAAGVARQAVLAHTADQFVAQPIRPATQAQKDALKNAKTASEQLKATDALGRQAVAKKKLQSGSVATVAYVGLIANLFLGTAFVLMGMHAMRSGILSKFMGVLGVIVGALTAVPLLGGAPVVQLFWLVAIGILFLNRWPQGRGPAWDAVESIPWPTAQDRRDAIAGPDAPARGQGRGRGGWQRAPEPDEDEPDEDEPGHDAVQHTREAARPRPSSTHPRSKKRKRKRRG
jgi:hypothetical protein